MFQQHVSLLYEAYTTTAEEQLSAQPRSGSCGLVTTHIPMQHLAGHLHLDRQRYIPSSLP